MYLLTSTRSGVAAKELERALGVTYKCAWRMAHELRKLMTSADYGAPLSGHVEIDETWVGGVRRKGGKGSSKRQSKKTIIMGMVERDGMLLALSEWVSPAPGETAEETPVRFRTVGDATCTGAVRSEAATVGEIIAEVVVSRVSERGATRADDRFSETSMEDRKREGYF